MWRSESGTATCVKHATAPDPSTRNERAKRAPAIITGAATPQKGRPMKITPAKTSSPNAKPTVTLVGQDGNAFNVLGLCQRAAKRAGWPPEQIDAVMQEMRSGDYDHLLQTAMEHFDVR